MQKAIRFVLASAGALVGLLLLVPVVLLALPFWAVAGLQAAAKRALVRSRPTTVSWQDMMEYEPELGWKPKGGIDAWAENVPPFHVRTDPDGWRGPGVAIEDADVVVFGDSFAFGHGADEDRFFANLPGGPVIKAIGANGYSMVQGLLWMRRYAARLRGKTVVWLVYYGNDLYDNLQPNMGRYRIPFVRRGSDAEGWETVTNHVSAEPWRFSTSTDYTSLLVEICSPTYLSDRVFDACATLVAEASDVCSAAGARLIVIGNPDVEMLDSNKLPHLRKKAKRPTEFDPALPDRRFAEICGDLGIPFIALTDWLAAEDHLPEDVHWSPVGHEKVHALISRVCAADPDAVAAV
jgi:hypothetical protein